MRRHNIKRGMPLIGLDHLCLSTRSEFEIYPMDTVRTGAGELR